MDSNRYLVAVGLIDGQDLTDEVLTGTLTKLKVLYPDITDEWLTGLRKELESNFGVKVSVGIGLHGGDQGPWLEQFKSQIQWTYWDSYVQELKASGKNREVIRVIDEDTDNILTECGNPRNDAAWHIKGLVMGDVQSGKTSNYTGLVNKAADAGYKIIVLLTGMIEDLRGQTQERLDEGFIGRLSIDMMGGFRDRKPVGVGRFRSKVPNVLTSVESDFLTANGRVLGGIPLSNISEPVLLVMKKNKSPLENLLKFLKSQLGDGVIDLPLLLIDDEADNASVNAKKDEDPATINKLIRALLARFRKTCYVAYTATPFANVFINPDLDDLFPSNFVYALNPPTNYVGAQEIFTEEGSQRHQLMDIDDAAPVFPPKHDRHLQVDKLPASLLEAVSTFLISCAIRDLRNELLRHRAMLVNATRFTDVQGQIAELIKSYLYFVQEDIRQYIADDELWSRHESLVALHETWKTHYSKAGFTWAEVRAQLHDSVASVKVVRINQKAEFDDKLNYRHYKNLPKGRRIIAVGGLTLSRGLTLEGLCISYFYRDSKAYDTLLQMARWFGYRTGYDDLCRVWMDPDVQGWFEHIAEVIDELKMDIRRMHANRQPPIRFGMKVRSHADMLVVTAANKMRNSEEVIYRATHSESAASTPLLPKDKKANDDNLDLVRGLVSSLGNAELLGTKNYWRNVARDRVVSLLRALSISPMNSDFVPESPGGDRPLLRFIESTSEPILQNWDICIPEGDGAPIGNLSITDVSGKVRAVKARRRMFQKSRAGEDFLRINKQRIGDAQDEATDLSKPEIAEIEAEWEELRKNDPKKGAAVPGYMYRRMRKRPLLNIVLINPAEPSGKHKDRMQPLEMIEAREMVAVSLIFPRFDEAQEDSDIYSMNLVALRRLGLADEQTDGEDYED
ncbi:MAG: hypothetical protein E6R07_00530 [Nevskiaceae bacterium]|nr:MAG: hypothetical protein E6R07_00530 [Nevskiaceae bacterium]